MTDGAPTAILGRLIGEHVYDRGTRAANWFGLWLFIVGGGLAVSLAEAQAHGGRYLRATPSMAAGVLAGAIVGVSVIRGFNKARYLIGEDRIERRAPWPGKSWRVYTVEVESVLLEPNHGHWVLVLLKRGGERRRVTLTKSMRDALDLT
jgi:hypothetical protein